MYKQTKQVSEQMKLEYKSEHPSNFRLSWGFWYIDWLHAVLNIHENYSDPDYYYLWACDDQEVVEYYASFLSRYPFSFWYNLVILIDLIADFIRKLHWYCFGIYHYPCLLIKKAQSKFVKKVKAK
jgi:hypothetical protein